MVRLFCIYYAVRFTHFVKRGMGVNIHIISQRDLDAILVLNLECATLFDGHVNGFSANGPEPAVCAKLSSVCPALRP